MHEARDFARLFQCTLFRHIFIRTSIFVEVEFRLHYVTHDPDKAWTIGETS